jgi:hypothetical protein
MTGAALMAFFVSIIVLFGVGTIFFIAVDGVAKNPMLAKIAKVAVGCLILIVFIMAVANVLGMGGGGPSVSPWGVIIFAVGVLVLLVVMYIIDLFLNWLAPAMGLAAPVVEAVRYVVTVIAIIALLLVAGDALLSGSVRWPLMSHASNDRTPAQDRDLGR